MIAPRRVAVDARHADEHSLWGSARYARELLGALKRRSAKDAVAVTALSGPRRCPEVVWEQVLLSRALRAGGFAAVHAPNCFLPLRRPCPGIVTVHDLAFEEHPEDFPALTGVKYRALVPRAVRSAERVICVSQFTRQDVIARYRVDPERTRVIPNAGALARSEAQPPPGPYIVAVGALRAKKNLGRLIEAFRRLLGEGLPHRLVLAGPDVGGGTRLRALAGDAPIDIPGRLDEKRLDALLRGADLLVHPSLYEGFGLVVIEAMDRGCPVALARATALPETAGDAAVYFDPLDVGDMAATMRRALEDRALRRRLVVAGHARAEAFSWDATAQRTAAVYEEVAL